MTATLSHLVASYGLAAVLLLMAAESCGLPFPSEVIMPVAGLLAVLVGRVVPVVRTYISFPAGLARLSLGPFAVLTFIGALPWCAMLTAVGYFLGANYDRVSGPIQTAAIAIAVVVVGLLALWYVRGRSTSGSRA